MTAISRETQFQTATPLPRLPAPRWLMEAGHVALREAVALAVLALIITSGFGWFWSDPLAFERSDVMEEPAPIPPGSEAGRAESPVPDFARADPVQLGAIEPAAGDPPPATHINGGGGADIATQAPVPLWRRNAVAAAPGPGKLRIAIIIDDLGLQRAASDRVVALPAPLTLAIMSYAKDAQVLAREARAAGHELLLDVPMEPEGHANPGPHALTMAQTQVEFERQLAWALDRFEGYVGINNHMGSRVTAAGEQMSWLFEELDRRGLMFVDSRTTKNTVAPMLAAHFGLPFAERDVFLDNEFGAGAVVAQLKVLEAEARRNGFAVAIGHPHRRTIAALQAWIPTLAEKGIDLVPVSAIAALHDPETALSLN